MVSSFQPSHVNPKTISYQNVPFNDESNLSVVYLFKACPAMWNVFGEYLHRWQCYNVAVLYADCYENVTELQSLQEYLHRWLLLRAINWSSFFKTNSRRSNSTMPWPLHSSLVCIEFWHIFSLIFCHAMACQHCKVA